MSNTKIRKAAALAIISAVGILGTSMLTPAGEASADEPTCAQKFALELSAEFPSVAINAQVRPDPYGDHAQGKALDVLIDNYNDPDRIQTGYAIVDRVQQLGADGVWPVAYTIFRQTYRTPAGDSVQMEDRGDDLQNHMSLIHISLTTGAC